MTRLQKNLNIVKDLIALQNNNHHHHNNITIIDNGYYVIPASPGTGILYVTKNSPDFISGHVRMRGRDNGSYPYKYLEMIDSIFGKEPNTIEVCSNSVSKEEVNCFTVDINPATNPALVCDGQTLNGIPDCRFDRWRCDPPYSLHAAKKMYGTDLPDIGKLLKAGARVCKPGSLLFLLLGPDNHQACPIGVKRIGLILITIVPNNEIRALNIYYKK